MAVRLVARHAARNAAIAAAAIGLLGGAADPDAAMRLAHAQDVRLLTVGYGLARGCRGLPVAETTQVTTGGMLIQDIAQYDAAQRDAARRVMTVGDGPTLVAVVPGSAAGRAGLRPGDRILAVNGAAIGADAGRNGYARMTQLENAMTAAPRLGSYSIDVRRADGSAFGTTLFAEAGCASIFQLVGGGLGRTVADGRYVQISQSMFDLATSDDALAAIVAHELAHNALAHAARKTPSKQAEYEADRLSVWLVARAGYDLDAVMPFWETVRKRSDYGIFADGTHPGWKKRLAAIADAVAAVKAQRAAAQELVPPPQQSSSQARNRR